jgi:hypothetical protein
VAEIALIGPQPNLDYYDPDHTYYFDLGPMWGRVRIDSVSQSMGISGLKGFDPEHWRRSLMNKGFTDGEATAYMELHRDQRAELGTMAHRMIENHLRGQPVVASEPEALAMFVHWRNTYAPRIQVVGCIEQPRVHPDFLFSGTPDFGGQLLTDSGGSANVLSDYKSKALPPLPWETVLEPKRFQEHGKLIQRKVDKVSREPWWVLQLGAYDLLLQRVDGIRVDYAENVILTAGGILVYKWNRAELDDAANVFLHGHYQTLRRRQAEDPSGPWGLAAEYLADHLGMTHND